MGLDRMGKTCEGGGYVPFVGFIVDAVLSYAAMAEGGACET